VFRAAKRREICREEIGVPGAPGWLRWGELRVQGRQEDGCAGQNSGFRCGGWTEVEREEENIVSVSGFGEILEKEAEGRRTTADIKNK